MPDAASMQTVTAPSTIHAGCTRRIELTRLVIQAPRVGIRTESRKTNADLGIWRRTPDAQANR
jgi:hypothetical protein